MLKYCNRDFYETLVKMKSFVQSDQECFTQRHSGWICSEMSKCPLPAQNRNGDSAMNQTRKNSAKPALLSKLEPAIRHRPVMVTFFLKMVLFASWAASRKRATYLWQYGLKEIWRSPDPYIRPVWKTKLQVELDQEPLLVYSGCHFFFICLFSC